MPRVGDMIPSKFLKRSDLGETEEAVLTISGVSEENAGTEQAPDMKWALLFREIPKPMILNKTNLQLLERILGSDDSDHWKGKRITVWFDESVQYMGEIKGGLRVKRAPGPAKGAPPPPAQHDSDDDIPF